MLSAKVNVILVVLMLGLLHAPLCNTQGFFILVNPLPDDGETLLSSLQETEYNIFKEGGIRFRCYCHEGIASLSWTHNGVLLASPTDCDPSNPLTHTVTSASDSDSGEYVCEAVFNATASSRIRIQLEVVGSDTIIAPPKQYALINTSASLNCSTTLSGRESNSISISWHRGDQLASEVFDSVSLAHEGMYECRLYIALLGLETTRMINFSVIVPPAILQKPSNRYHLVILGNQAATIPVRFQSRLREDTVIAWYKNENSAVRKDYIHTEWGEEPFGTTEVRFSNLRRRDSGVYRVVIRNNFEGIPQELRQVDTSFELKVTTLPAAPSNILMENIGSTSAIAQWSLTNQNADDLPDNITARLYYSNGTLTAQYTLDGQETSLPLSLLPGMQYSLHMSAANVDGVSESEPKEFQTPDGAPYPPHVSVERVSNISFHLIVSFFYTGGGNITQLIVSFRRINSQEEWTRLRTVPIVPTGSYLQWRAVVTNEAFIEPGVEFRVMAINARGYISVPVVLPEPIGFFILVNPLPDDGETLLSSLQETEYNIFKEGGIRFRCFCHEGIASLSWTHNGVLLAPPTDCDPSNPLTHTVTNASASDSGEYVCEAIFNATASSRIRIQLEVVGSDTIIAPPKQYALINTSASLNCSTTLSKEESNSISISWHRENQPASEVFNSVSLAHEGMYECRLYIALLDQETTRMINFSVIVPPAILQKPTDGRPLYGNQGVSFPVRFQSRLREDTVIAWYKNENSTVRRDYIHTEWGEKPFGTTEVRFSNLRRRDSGVYRVVIRNNFEGIPQELRQVDTSFELKVSTLPVAPSNILIENIGSTSAIAQWSLTNQNADDPPDNITVRLYYSNGTLAAQYTLDGQETSLPLSLLPGMQYSLHMSAANVDGVSESEPKQFQTPDGAPHPPHVSVERVSNISFHLIVSFFYTGGGNITQLKVFFTRINSQEEWTRLRTVPIVPTGSYLQWRAVVTNEAFIEPGVEFRVIAINSRGYISAPVVQAEPLNLPGPPKRPIFASSTHNSVVFQVELSSEGDSPILSLAIDFLSPNTTIPPIYGNYQPGQLVLLTVSGLEASTTYRFTVSAVNYGGKGEPSPAVEATTEELPLLPLYGIVLVSVATALAIIILVVILFVIRRHLYNIQRAKKMYKISECSQTTRHPNFDAVDNLQAVPNEAYSVALQMKKNEAYETITAENSHCAAVPHLYEKIRPSETTV